MRHYDSTLAVYRYGGRDLTTRIGAREFWRASWTPDGPATLHLHWPDGVLHAEAWGDGAQWLLAHVPAITGDNDPGHLFSEAHPVVMAAQRRHGHLRLGASGVLYHELLPIILGQRVTVGEAYSQWHDLVRELGTAAPGPASGLLLPPAPEALRGRPAWWFHRLGIESSRAETLREVARHPEKLFTWSATPPAEATRLLRLLPGVGQWTAASAVAAALGDPDAVAVGDYHLKNTIVHALTGRARGTDDEMLELLQPYVGQRGRVVRWLLADGHHAPAFGPRQRILRLGRR